MIISPIGIGSEQFCGNWGEDYTQNKVDQILGAAEGLGINFIDTAGSYGNHLSESFIGRSIKRRREHWVVSSKFGYYYQKNIKIRDFSVASVRKQLESSLRALCTDYIDIFFFHSGSNHEFINDELWYYLNNQVRAGTIKALGLSISHKYIQRADYTQLDYFETIQY